MFGCAVCVAAAVCVACDMLTVETESSSGRVSSSAVAGRCCAVMQLLRSFRGSLSVVSRALSLCSGWSLPQTVLDITTRCLLCLCFIGVPSFDASQALSRLCTTCYKLGKVFSCLFLDSNFYHQLSFGLVLLCCRPFLRTFASQLLEVVI